MKQFWSELLMWCGVGLFAVAAVLPSQESLSYQAKGEPVTAVVDVAAPQTGTDMSTELLAGFDSTRPRAFQTAEAATASSQRMGKVTGVRVNLRRGPSTRFDRVGSVQANDLLELTGARDGAWVEVVPEGALSPAWIHGKFISDL
ncbi:MAG: SH3 domain-containing protein [Pseudomonadota bacterium]